MPTSRPHPIVVVGYDGSESGRAAVALAARHAGRRGKVFVVHAYDAPPDFLGSPNFGHLLEERRAHGEALLEAMPLIGNEELLDVRYETELIAGSPAAAITEVAATRNADEIVVGARGLGRIRSLLGSVSHEVIERAQVPVTVVPPAAVERTLAGPASTAGAGARPPGGPA